MWYRQDMQNRLSNLFGIDPRSLAAFRIGLGILLLADLLIRATDLEAHYTDAGVVPRDILLQRMPHSKWLSCHLLGGSATFEACLFLVAAILAIGVMVGYRTRIAVVASWAMLVSLQTRNTLVLNGGDVLLRMLIFWAMFLPLNMCWSIDSRHRLRRKTLAILSPASAAILIHVCVMYWMTGMFKLEGWLETKDAFAQVIGFQSYSKPFVRELLQYPRFVHWMGYGVLTLELLGPAIVFCPFGTKLLRIIVAAAFVCLHLGIEVSLTVGLFTYVSWLAWLLFLPDVFWNTLASWMSTSNYDWVGRADAADSDRLSGADAFKTKLPQRMLNCGLCLVLAYVLVWNVSTARKPWNDAVRDYTPAVLNDLLLVRQQWNMFTRPSTYDGWFVMVARLKDGRVLDLLRDGQPADWNSFSKPDWIYRRYPNHRWRKMYRNIAIGRADAFLSPLCNYAALRWNRLHSAEAAVQKIELHFMQQMGLEPELQDTFMQRILHQEEILNPASALRLDIGLGVCRREGVVKW